jgi:hypothetical protein
MASTLHEYMEDRKRECSELSLHLNDRPVFAAEASSGERRGRILLTLNLTERANLEVSEWVEVQGNSVHRLEYAYYLVIDGQEYRAWDFDSIHGYHGHKLGREKHERIEAGRVTFKEAAEIAWEIVSQEEELTGTEPVELED